MNPKIFATIATLTLSLVPQTPLRADVVTDWNEITLATLAAMNEARPSPSSRTLAIVHVAIYDAVNSIEHRFSPYAVDAEACQGSFRRGCRHCGGLYGIDLALPEPGAISGRNLREVPGGHSRMCRPRKKESLLENS